jgi:hypothetical protein
MKQTEKVDHSAIRVNQVFAMTGMVIAFVLGRWEIVAALSVAFLLASISPAIGPFNLIYNFILKPVGLVKPDFRDDYTEPHRFGQAIGFVFAGIAAYLLYAGYAIIGWSVVWILVALTAVSFAGWCMGCYFYYMLNKLGMGGFFKHSPSDEGVVVGAHPRRSK